MRFYKQNNFDNGNLINTETIEIKRNQHNMPVLLGYTHNDEFYEATVRHDGSIYLSKAHDTIFEYESEQHNDNQDFICIYTDRAIQDLKAWVASNGLPDFSSEPITVSEIRYIEEHAALGKLAIECVVNGYSGLSFGIDLETMKVNDFVFDEIPEILIEECIEYGGDIETIKRHNEIDREISRQLNAYIESDPYHPAYDMLSFKMEYGVRYLNYDFSGMRCYNEPVTVEGEKGRLVVNRKDSFWEACLYINSEKWAKMEQDETPKNGGFARMDHVEFISRVCTVYGFMKGIFIDLEVKQKAA